MTSASDDPTMSEPGHRRTLAILHHDARLVAVDKPAGMVVHRSEWCPDGEPVLQRLRDQIGQRLYPVHRLDRATSGVLVFALDPEAARHLAEQFAAHTIDKRYVAIVRGWPDAAGVIDSPLAEDPSAPSHPAVTEYARAETVELAIPVGRYATARYALVDVRPRTGRMHQIRRHFAHLRHPIVGDVRYGDGRHNRMWRGVLAQPGMMLRAVSIAFQGPDGEAVRIEAERRLALPEATAITG